MQQEDISQDAVSGGTSSSLHFDLGEGAFGIEVYLIVTFLYMVCNLVIKFSIEWYPYGLQKETCILVVSRISMDSDVATRDHLRWIAIRCLACRILDV